MIASSSACPSAILGIINHQLIAPSSADISHPLLSYTSIVYLLSQVYLLFSHLMSRASGRLSAITSHLQTRPQTRTQTMAAANNFYSVVAGVGAGTGMPFSALQNLQQILTSSL